ncbi:hypothetical protein AVEN_106710-1 [Araneus ventricosus]|uniref:Uncharacterized protein n=1 Tax=Araneus ventricosus TaxID=182803 RepID=A0A4Y2F1S7_ARAVE|nr:hypothetical protein AVEN_106710-1 [Araneus ventricosus]
MCGENSPTSRVTEDDPTSRITENDPTSRIPENDPTSRIPENYPTSWITENDTSFSNIPENTKHSSASISLQARTADKTPKRDSKHVHTPKAIPVDQHTHCLSVIRARSIYSLPDRP